MCGKQQRRYIKMNQVRYAIPLLLVCIVMVDARSELVGMEIDIERKASGDVWTEREHCDACACRGNSTYMVNIHQSRSCYSNRDIELEYGKNNLVTINQRNGAYLISYDLATESWQQGALPLQTYDGEGLSWRKCINRRIIGIDVYNYDVWQKWTNEHFRLVHRNSYIALKFQSNDYATFSGHLINIKIGCNEIEYNLLLKFQGKRHYKQGVTIPTLSNRTNITTITAITPPNNETNKLNNTRTTFTKTSLYNPKSGIDPESGSKESSSASVNQTAVIVGATFGGIGLVISIIAIVFIVYNKRLKDKHLSAIEKQKNGTSMDGGRVIVNKDVLELAHEILQERAEKMKNKPDVIPKQEPGEGKPPEQETTVQKQSLKKTNSAHYEPIVDEKTGYTEPNPDKSEEKSYQGIYLQPVDSHINVPVYENTPELSPVEEEEDLDEGAYEIYGID